MKKWLKNYFSSEQVEARSRRRLEAILGGSGMEGPLVVLMVFAVIVLVIFLFPDKHQKQNPPHSPSTGYYTPATSPTDVYDLSGK